MQEYKAVFTIRTDNTDKAARFLKLLQQTAGQLEQETVLIEEMYLDDAGHAWHS
jgi:hypothetical protein